MKARGAVVQGGLAALGLVAAYATWQRAPESNPEDVVILDLSRGDLEKVRFDDGTRWTELERGKDSTPENPYWIRFGTRPAPSASASPAADGGTPVDGGTTVAASLPPAPKPPPDRELKTSDQAERLMEKLAPLRGIRALGALGPDKLRELGLEGSSRRLEVVARGASRSFTVSSGGPGSPYLLDSKDGKVYLISQALIFDLESASTRMVDRHLHVFKLNEVDALVLAAGDARRELVQTTDAVRISKVASKATPDKNDDFAKNYVEKLWGLGAVDLLGRGEVPATPPAIALRVDYQGKGKPLGFLELARGEGQDLYARTEHTVSWVKVQPPADEVLNDGKKLVEAK